MTITVYLNGEYHTTIRSPSQLTDVIALGDAPASAYTLDLTPIIAQAKATINAERDRRAELPLPVTLPDARTLVVQADARSQFKLIAAMSALSVQSSGASVDWTDINNVDAVLTMPDVATIVATGAGRADVIHHLGRALKASLDGMTLAQLTALDPTDDTHWTPPAT